ncbi:MAG: hypothetical protein ACOX0T_03020 [Pelotomaculum sp.]
MQVDGPCRQHVPADRWNRALGQMPKKSDELCRVQAWRKNVQACR